MTAPSDLAIGEVVSGWRVEKQFQVFPGQSGGAFSRGYMVSKDGRNAFLKAMDLSQVMDKSLDVMSATINQYLFEGQLFKVCADSGLSNIVRMIDQGEFIPTHCQAYPNALFFRVFYIIFELATDGDIRRYLNFDSVKTCSWRMHVLHQISVALNQLHSIGITHQDVKPSNVLCFTEQKKFKLTDLGRSNSIGHPALTDQLTFPGDWGYAPLEYFYKYIPPDYQNRRIGSDIYLLGSMISFLYLGVGALNHTLGFLPRDYWHSEWKGTFQDVLPFLVDAHSKATNNLIEQLEGNLHQKEIGNIYFELCHPNPELRGSPKARAINAGLGLNRYITTFDRISKSLAVQERIQRMRNVG